MRHNRLQTGATLIEILVVVGIVAVIGMAVSFGLRFQGQVRDATEMRSEAFSIKTLMQSPLSCDRTVITGGVPLACANTAPMSANCDAPTLPSGDDRWLDLKRDNGTVFFEGAPAKRGAIETRVCCPGGALRAEWRILTVSGAPKVDPLNGNLTYDWQPVFRVASPCNSVSATQVNRKIVYGNLTPTIYQCPGFFPEQTFTLFNYPKIAEGTAKCPAGTKLVGGGVNCPFWPMHGVIANRPYKPSATDKNKWAETADTWFASCCFLLPIPAAVYAICE